MLRKFFVLLLGAFFCALSTTGPAWPAKRWLAGMARAAREVRRPAASRSTLTPTLRRTVPYR